MNPAWWVVAFWMDCVGIGQAPAMLPRPHQVEKINCRLHGQLLDFTHNHGHDRRIWSAALCQRRDMYVYLPPGFDPKKKYPVAIFLHGAGQDEQFFLQTQVERFDRAMVNGEVPPVIVAAPDGSWRGKPTLLVPATFWANSKVGCFEDFVMFDVWNFLMANFPILPDRDAHALVGVSAGGTAAFNMAIKHKERVKVAIGFHPLLNLRYVDCRGKYRSDFDPETWTMRTQWHGWESLGRRRLITLRFNDLFAPLFGRGQAGIEGLSRINPLELMEGADLRDGELDLFVGYGGMDEFNVKAQTESFLYCAARRGVKLTVAYEPDGKHNLETGDKLSPAAMKWIAERVPEPRLSQWRQDRARLVPGTPTALPKPR